MGLGQALQVPQTVNIAKTGPGQPLPTAVQRHMEAFFKTDFSGVRIHVGPQANAIGALAFTMGSDIFFSPGQYDPGSIRGRQLLGHELTHVVQQRRNQVSSPFSSGVAVILDPHLEAEADRNGRLVEALQMSPSPRMARNPPGSPRSSVVQRITYADAYAGLSPREKHVFRYWVNFEIGRARLSISEFLKDEDSLSIKESLLVWGQGANLKYLKEVTELDKPTQELLPTRLEGNVGTDLTGDPVDGKTQLQHMAEARLQVFKSGCLVRRISEIEANLFRNGMTSIDQLRPKGLLNGEGFPVERAIAFSLETEYKFANSSRNAKEDWYTNTLKVRVTPELFEYLLWTLWNNKYKSGVQRKYRANPQFKSESGRYNIIIPPEGWREFWSIASRSFEVN